MTSKFPAKSQPSDRRLTIVVPAFNEADHIEKTLVTVCDVASKLLDDYEVIMVDDGSSDSTGDIAERFVAAHSKVRVKRQPSNQGVGAAYLYGLREARFPYLSLVPGDNVFTREAIENVFSVVGNAPLVISYRDNMTVRTRFRHGLSVICTTMMRLISGRSIRDAHSMYVFPVEIARTIPVQPGYGYHIESLGQLLYLVSDFVEVPSPLNPRPDANSGVMKPRVVWLLGMTMLRLASWRLSTVLRTLFRSTSTELEATRTNIVP
jgi:dolichol-phosphate mannosyltransferase